MGKPFKNIAQLNKTEKKKIRELNKKWKYGHERVLVSNVEETLNHKIDEFQKEKLKRCPHCAGLMKKESQATINTWFYRCLSCNLLSEFEEGERVSLFESEINDYTLR